jgi:hypothetical protein
MSNGSPLGAHRDTGSSVGGVVHQSEIILQEEVQLLIYVAASVLDRWCGLNVGALAASSLAPRAEHVLCLHLLHGERLCLGLVEVA